MPYIANAPRDSTFFARGGGLVSLALDTEVHDVVTADSAVVNNYVPGPESYSVPLCHVSPALSRPWSHAYLLDLEALLIALCAGSGLGDLGLRWGRIRHIYVGHGCEMWWKVWGGGV